MLNMSQINDIRDLKQSGYRIADIHKKTGIDPKTINKYLSQEDFSQSPPVKKQKPTILDPYKETIAEWVREDNKHWNKQRHTAKRIYDRLRDECGYTGSYDTVQKYMQSFRPEADIRATQELIWEPGYAQADFGEADVYENGRAVRRKYLVLSFPFSNDGYTQMFGGETAECVCQGLQDIFEYIGGVPRTIIFDNATGVGRRIREKIVETELFSRFRAHYGFKVRFCNPRSGHEKGNAENKVGTVRRNLFVPVPKYSDIEEYNKHLLDKHHAKAAEAHYKKGVEIASLFEQDRKEFLPIPPRRFNICRYDWFRADGYGKICMEGKHFYSTRPENHGQKVLVGIMAHYIDILNRDGSLLIRHKRQYGDERTDISDYSTSLEVLSQNAGAWKNSGVRRDAPELLRDYLDSLEKPDLKENLRLLNRLSKQYGYRASINAMLLALKNGSLNVSDATVLAARITGYGIDTPPESGPPLTVYDETFLSGRKGGDLS